ncbi:hypothetical protein GGQ11_003389 [Salinibacter ruber]|uniref:hypothetical protein n=1 Tax=Salinibacter ruber TaxID=146919 RepID=UPI002168160A|nr:hypothetical protein [Salinibacter ruber]MCS3658583.1 hypothetical protein [Salinibacter ruber]
MSEIDEIKARTEKISRQQLRAETSGGGRSTQYEVFKELALELPAGGDGAKITELTESQVSSIRTQINYLNDDDAEEKEFVATRRKMKTDAGEDVEDEDGNQLYNLYISHEETEEVTNEEQQESQDSEEVKPPQSDGDEQDEYESEADKAFDEMFDE